MKNIHPLGRAAVHIDIKKMHGLSILKTFPSDGIRLAFDRAADAYAADQTFENLCLCVNLWEIIEQQGCSEIDGDGSLTNLIDILIRG